ncbi:MAG: hypothetical protein ACO3XL_07325, partial [Gemmobacter sp.]
MDTHIAPPAPKPPRVMAEAPVELPPATLSRWSAERKADVVRALRAGGSEGDGGGGRPQSGGEGGGGGVGGGGGEGHRCCCVRVCVVDALRLDRRR